MKILLISQYFLPQPLANAEVVGGLATELGARGHQVRVVAPVDDLRTAPGVTGKPALGWFAPDRASIPQRLAEYLSFSIGAVVGGLRGPRPDVIVVPSPPPTLGAVGAVVAGLRRVPLVYNVQDLYPEIADTVGGMPSTATRVMRRLVRRVYDRSAAVVVIDPTFEPLILRSAPGSVVRAVRNGIDLGPFADATRDDSFLASLGVEPGAPVVMYAGNVGRSQDLDGVVAAAAAAGAELVVHGGGAGLDKAKADLGGRSHVHFSSFRPRSELGTVYASADLHVVPLKPGVARASVPSKLLSIFSAGRPAVLCAEDDSAAAAIVREAGGGWVVDPGDADQLAAAVKEALADPDELAARGKSARAWAEVNAGMDRMGDEWEAVLNEVVADSAAGR